MANKPQSWDPIEVTVEIDNKEHIAGTPWVHERVTQSATFRYVDEYLKLPLAYALDPILPLGRGIMQTPNGKTMFNAFSDSAPDRWGRNLMIRNERERSRAKGAKPRSLADVDFLLGSRDDIRQGAIRFRNQETKEYWSATPAAVPKFVSLPNLLSLTDAFVRDEWDDRDLSDLMNAGASLGGARPKAAVRTKTGTLAIAKFPHSGHDDWDVIRWEKLENYLALKSGVEVSPTHLLQVSKRPVLIVERFDRSNNKRVGYASALTMLEASDGDRRSYLEIAEVIERHSSRTRADLEQLYRRMVFSLLTSNTDDHLRNHGFTRGRVAWNLSPAFDLNPNPNQRGVFAMAIDLEDSVADIAAVLSVSEYFRLPLARAQAIVQEVEAGTRDWKDEARQLEIPSREIDLMAQAFETTCRQQARQLARPVV
jgi:serine/threonine-protein kinase HipA